jgi:hypothetical protein
MRATKEVTTTVEVTQCDGMISEGNGEYITCKEFYTGDRHPNGWGSVVVDYENCTDVVFCPACVAGRGQHED